MPPKRITPGRHGRVFVPARSGRGDESHSLRRAVFCAALLAASLGTGCYENVGPVLGPPRRSATPDVVPPVPTAAQLAWQTEELAAFVHFSLPTFTNQEVTDGTVSPTLFNPTALDARQWMTALRSGGFGRAMLTAKHHDGFCLWRSKCTDYTVAASPFRSGAGDVVREFVDAAREANIRVALAISPWDRHEPTYGTPAYAAVFECQLTELLTNYGVIDEIWLWRQPVVSELDWSVVSEVVHRLQPQALVQLANGPPTKESEVRSVGHGTPVTTTESNVRTVSGAATPIWVPAEAVYSIRADGAWFTNGEVPLLSVDQLVSLYLDTVGRNTTLLLNVPPDARGLFTDSAVTALGQFGLAIPALFRANVAAGRLALADSVMEDNAQFGADAAVDGKLDTAWVAARTATSGRLEIDLGAERTFDLVSIQEPVAFGERATRHQVEVRQGGVWTAVASGTVIGRRKLYRLSTAVTGDRVALVVAEARGAPAVSELGLYDSATTRMSLLE